MKNFKFGKQKTLRSRLIGAFLITILPLAISFVGLCALCYSSKDPTSSVRLYSLGALLLAAAISGFISGRLNDKSGILRTMLPAFTLSAVLFITGIIISGGAFSLRAIMNILCYVIIYAAFVLIGKRRKRRFKY